jgi:prophage antirepressor-like protein
MGTTDDPWFCGKDVALALGYVKTEKAIADHVDIDNKQKLSEILRHPKIGGPEKLTYNELQMIYINEPGLYEFIISSKLPSAKEFQKWVTSDVLPSIRKHGQYIIEQERIKLIKEREELDIEIRKQQLHNETTQTLCTAAQTIMKLCPEQSAVEKLFMKDVIENFIAEKSTLLAKSVKEKRYMKPLSDIVMDITGKPFKPADYCQLGKAVASEFRKRYTDKKIDKCERTIDGGTRMVNLYESKDLPWIEDIVRHYFDKKGIKSENNDIVESISKIAVD